MCRYTRHPSPTHAVCTSCRLSVKTHQVGPCARCGALMRNAGRDFAAPRATDRRQWAKVALLLDADVTFDGCGCGRGVGRPATLADARALALRARRCGLTLAAAVAEPRRLLDRERQATVMARRR